MKVPLIDSQGKMIAELEETQYPIKQVIKTIWGVREYVTHINYVTNENKILDKTKVKSVNMTLNK